MAHAAGSGSGNSNGSSSTPPAPLAPPAEKLPQNARRKPTTPQQQQQPLPVPVPSSPALPLAIGAGASTSRHGMHTHGSHQRYGSSLRARATEILSDPGDHHSSLSSSSPLSHRLSMERAEVARRVKRHLVMRPVSASEPAGPAAPRISHSLGGQAGLAVLFPRGASVNAHAPAAAAA
ncbi:hypothetical protein GGI02_005423, partial [Coemansia sp. RSA 2322]